MKEFKEDTIWDWLREAAHHAEQIESVLLNQYQISQAQIDGLWTYCGWGVALIKMKRKQQFTYGGVSDVSLEWRYLRL